MEKTVGKIWIFLFFGILLCAAGVFAGERMDMIDYQAFPESTEHAVCPIEDAPPDLFLKREHEPCFYQEDLMADFLEIDKDRLRQSAGEQDWAGPIETAVIDHLQLKDMDIMDVLKLLSERSGLNIIAGKNVKGSVSIYLKDVRLQDALRVILDANDLAYQEEDGIIRVMTAGEYAQRYGQVFGGRVQTRTVRMLHARAGDVRPFLEQIKSPSGRVIADENSNMLVLMDTKDKLALMMDALAKIDLPLDVQVFALHYALAKEIAEKIGLLLTKNIGRVEHDERSNTVIVSDTPDRMRAVRGLVRAFDVQDQQVLIEAKIVQIKLTDSFQLGVNWERVFPGTDGLSIRMDFDAIDSLEPNKGTVTIGTIESNNYTAMVEALKKAGETNILSSPSITALNNQEARILVGSTQPYVTTTVTTTASGPITTAETVMFIDVGVKLYVTPTIHPDGFITMKIRPEVSSVLDSLQTSQNNTIPIVETSEAETTVRIKDGVTIVIAGLIKDEEMELSRKVPILGAVPVLGAAFRSQSTSRVKTEIAIFLTPRIVSGGE